MKRLVQIFILIILVSASCGKKNEEINEASEKENTEIISNSHISEISFDDSADGIVRRIKVKNLGPLGKVFNDSNALQLQSAQKIGIKPITNVASAYFTGRPIVKIEDTENYKIDSLSHSLPYLVPEAAQLLDDIGRNFKDSLKNRGGDSHIIKVTSLLRTPESVSRLRRVNINATDSSTHQYATTFDISYNNFWCTDSNRLVHQGDLKNLLAEVLQDMRQQGRCYVKYERKTGCFHVTVVE